MDFAPSDKKILPLRIQNPTSMHGRPTCLNLVQLNAAETFESAVRTQRSAIDHRIGSASDGLDRIYVDTWNFQYLANPGRSYWLATEN
jgi:hypothetical protein